MEYLNLRRIVLRRAGAESVVAGHSVGVHEVGVRNCGTEL